LARIKGTAPNSASECVRGPGTKSPDQWWRRRESNPRPKGLSLQNSTCVAVLDISRAATKSGECAARQSVESRPDAPDSRQSQPAEWRSFPARRLTERNVAYLVRPRAQAACSQLRWFAHRFYERDGRARHAFHSPLPPSKPNRPHKEEVLQPVYDHWARGSGLGAWGWRLGARARASSAAGPAPSSWGEAAKICLFPPPMPQASSLQPPASSPEPICNPSLRFRWAVAPGLARLLSETGPHRTPHAARNSPPPGWSCRPGHVTDP